MSSSVVPSADHAVGPVEPAIDAALKDKLRRREENRSYTVPSPSVIADRLTRHLSLTLDEPF